MNSNLTWYKDDPAFIAISRNVQKKYPSMSRITVETRTLQIMLKEKRLFLKPLAPPTHQEPTYEQLSLY